MNKENIKNWEDLKDNLLGEYNGYFVERIERSRKIRPEICLIVLREVVDPVLVRSSDPERAELFVTKIKIKGSDGKETEREIIRARINGEKFTSVERLIGLNLCRVLNQNNDIISPNYLYNEICSLEEAINPDTITYGAVGVEKGETFSIKSRVIEGYTYTLEEYNLLSREQHNALYETGTMTKVQLIEEEKGVEEERGRGLYTHVNIEPPTKMIHFVRIEASTKEMFLYVLHNILNATTYFARSTRKGCIRNKILGVIFSRTSIGLSAGELIKEQFTSTIKDEYSYEEVMDAVQTYVNNHKNIFWKILWNRINNAEEESIKDFNKMIVPLMDIALLKDDKYKYIMRECLVELTKQGKEAYGLHTQNKQKGKAAKK